VDSIADEAVDPTLLEGSTLLERHFDLVAPVTVEIGSRPDEAEWFAADSTLAERGQVVPKWPP